MCCRSTCCRLCMVSYAIQGVGIATGAYMARGWGETAKVGAAVAAAAFSGMMTVSWLGNKLADRCGNPIGLKPTFSLVALFAGAGYGRLVASAMSSPLADYPLSLGFTATTALASLPVIGLGYYCAKRCEKSRPTQYIPEAPPYPAPASSYGTQDTVELNL